MMSRRGGGGEKRDIRRGRRWRKDRSRATMVHKKTGGPRGGAGSKESFAEKV